MKKQGLFFFIIVLGCLLHLKSQSVYVGGVFPTIDHSGMLSKRLEYGLYYFGAFPLVKFKAPKSASDASFLLFYSEQGLSFNLTSKLSVNASYVYQRENAIAENYINENRLHLQATYKHTASSIQFKHRIRLDNRFIQNRVFYSLRRSFFQYVQKGIGRLWGELGICGIGPKTQRSSQNRSRSIIHHLVYG
jgi:hypothetical protein